ncbi:MAG: helix-turn-helix domain-containing protein [Nitrososphaerales archaeon]
MTMYTEGKHFGSDQQSRMGCELEKKLVKLGLPLKEAKIYIHLAERGEENANEISMAISTSRKQTYLLLASLHNRGLITATFLHPIKFRAVPVIKALRFLISEITHPLQYYSPHHMMSQEKELRTYACVNCGTPYNAFAPDDQHTIAKDKICDKGDSRTVPYECSNCYYSNELHWDVEHWLSYASK